MQLLDGRTSEAGPIKGNIILMAERVLPLDFKSAVLYPEIPTSGRSYVEFELGNVGMALMVGVSPLFHSVEGGEQDKDGWMFSVLDHSLWHKDREIHPGEEYEVAEERDVSPVSARGSQPIAFSIAASLRWLDLPRVFARLTRGYSMKGAQKGDRVGLLVDRSLGTMTVFVNDVQQPAEARGLPSNERLYFAVELLHDPQYIRIVDDATPPVP